MTSYQVTVMPDEKSPTQGTAVVRIEGLKAWPDAATVRLLPIDDTAVPANSDGWPWEPIKPQQVTITDNGVDVVLGPEIVASPRLLPGTPLTIKVGAANLEVEARWPSIVPVTRRRNGAAAMTAAQLTAAKAERERAEKEAARRRQEAAEKAVQAANGAAGVGVSPAAAASSVAEQSGQLARLVPLRRTGADAAGARTATGSATSTATQLPNSGGQLARLGPAPPSNIVPMPQPPAPLPGRRGPGMRGFAAGLITMAGIAALIVTLSPSPWWTAGGGGARFGSGVPDQIATADLKMIFKDFAAGGAQSPRGKSAANVDTATALSLADHSLRGQRSEGETAEAAFWLKKALSGNLGGPDVGWALTQLGTIYATAGTPEHSYVKAHAIWELAAAQGDPVAHCFLGALYEHGLGVAKDKKAAREHYLTADALGACKSAKDAAARLSE